MYIPRSILSLLVVVYLLFLLSADWINEIQIAWYRPFIVGLVIIMVAAWSHRNRDGDEL